MKRKQEQRTLDNFFSSKHVPGKSQDGVIRATSTSTLAIEPTGKNYDS